MKTQPDQQLPESICDDGSIAIPNNEDAQEILAMHQHTPGDWEASRVAVPKGHVQITVYAGDVRVATVFDREANARLIVAAPKLLEVLQMADLAEHKADVRGPCLCSQCEFRRAARAVIDATKP